MEAKAIFIETLVGQIRALDQFGTWGNKSNEDLLGEKYIKSKDELKKTFLLLQILMKCKFKIFGLFIKLLR